MTRWAPQKADTLAALATEIEQTNPDALVGVFGAGAGEFASELAELAEPGLIVVAQAGELSKAVAGEFNYTIWLEDGPEDRTSRANASAIIDVSNPEHPRRVFADSC